MLTAMLAAAALLSDPGAPRPQTPPVQPAPQIAPAQEEATRLEDVTVTGRPLETLIETFVEEVAAPVRGRNLARWDAAVCVAVANFEGDAARYLADRISTVAQDVGLRAGQPGCRPNIMVVGTVEASALAREMVDRSPRHFREGGAGMDRGGAALSRFQDSQDAVRWWQVVLPTDEDTGERAVRMPGDCRRGCMGGGSVYQMAPLVKSVFASRLRSPVVENLYRAIVIVDLAKVSHLSQLQLADYIAMVTLAQVNPEGDPTAYASILNVLNRPSEVASLTDWDTSYLAGLYSAQRGRIGLGSGRSEVVSSIRRAHAELAARSID